MTPTELKETLIKQYNEAIVTIQRLEGALSACTELINSETTEDTSDSQETDD